MALQHSARHSLGYLFVVVQLTLVFPKKRSGNLTIRGVAVMLQQRLQHERLVDVRHPHFRCEEPAEAFKGGVRRHGWALHERRTLG
ncbi:MAG TPA: hypothetical protein VKE51_11510 [Vicinamibacterales bacterium]|nr:hypothetical protein [Vicinamibacterales bacterium]